MGSSGRALSWPLVLLRALVGGIVAGVLAGVCWRLRGLVSGNVVGTGGVLRVLCLGACGRRLWALVGASQSGWVMNSCGRKS